MAYSNSAAIYLLPFPLGALSSWILICYMVGKFKALSEKFFKSAKLINALGLWINGEQFTFRVLWSQREAQNLAFPNGRTNLRARGNPS